MHKKRSGMTLVELMFAFALGSMITAMLYQVFMTMQKSTVTLREMNELYALRAISNYHFKRDFQGILLPVSLKRFYEVSKELNKKKEKDSVLKQSETPLQEAEQHLASKNEKQENGIQKEYEAFLRFMPQGRMAEDENVVTFVTTRSLLTSLESPSRTRISYILRPHAPGSSVYRLVRKEEPWDVLTHKENDNLRGAYEYTLIENFENPRFEWYVPDLDREELAKQEKEEINKILRTWKEHPLCKKQGEFKVPEQGEEVFERPFLPYALSLEGTLLSTFGSRRLPLKILLIVDEIHNALEHWVFALSKTSS